MMMVCTPTVNYQKEKLRKQSHYIATKNKVSRNKFNQGVKRPVLRKPHNTGERN